MPNAACCGLPHSESEVYYVKSSAKPADAVYSSVAGCVQWSETHHVCMGIHVASECNVKEIGGSTHPTTHTNFPHTLRNRLSASRRAGRGL